MEKHFSAILKWGFVLYYWYSMITKHKNISIQNLNIWIFSIIVYIFFDLHGISFVPMVLWLLEKPSTTYRQNCKPYQSNLLVHICMMYLRLHSNGMGKCNIKSICEMSVNLEQKFDVYCRDSYSNDFLCFIITIQ